MSLGGAIGYDDAGLDEEVMRRRREAVIAFSNVTSV